MIDPAELGTTPDLEAITANALAAEPFMRVNGRRPNIATIYRKFQDGTFPHVKIGGQLVTTRRWVLDAISNGSKRIPTAARSPRQRQRQFEQSMRELQRARIA